MLTRKDQADGIDKQHFGQEVFDLCWTSESEPMSMTLAEPHYGGQTFDMCWTTQTDLTPVVSALAKALMAKAMPKALMVQAMPNTPMVQAMTDTLMVQATATALMVKVMTNASIIQATAKAPMVKAMVKASLAKPLYGSQGKSSPIVDTLAKGLLAKLHYGGQAFDMCWDRDTTPTEDIPAVECQGGFDMCWEDSLAGDGLHAVHPTTLTNPAPVRSSQLAPLVALSEGLVIAIARVEAGKKLVTQADKRLHRMYAIMKGNQSPAASALIEGN
ncbi:hypothetical protein BDR04DRAFT_1121840 [Suillus decipiens]|nr:hypothetical protein BDR04DRAFT_1121840 [Suillus decipiens]